MFIHKLIPKDVSVHKIDKDKFSMEIELSKEEALFLFAEMLKMYVFENYALKNYDSMRGFLHLGIGQECFYAFLKHWFKKTRSFDEYLMIGSYRCHNMAYASGSSFLDIARELLGRKTSPQKGKGGSMHLYNDKCFGGHGIVGAQVSIGTGLAFGVKYFQTHKELITQFENDRRSRLYENMGECSSSPDKESSLSDSFLSKSEPVEKVNCYRKDSALYNYPLSLQNKKAVFVFLGDGAANQGQVYESYNIALVHKLPIIFIIENNHVSMWTDTKTVSDTENFHSRWEMMPGVRIHSNNVFVVCCIMEQILQYSELPIVVQIDTTRHCKHSAKDEKMFDINTLRSRSKDTSMHELESILLNAGLNTEVEFLWKNIDSEMLDCWKTALSEELPTEDELLKDIIA